MTITDVMEGQRVLLLCVFLTLSLVNVRAYICNQAICEYTFDIDRARTLTYYNGDFAYNVELNGTRLQAVKHQYKLDVDDETTAREIDPNEIITTDGYVRDVITINGKFPGPDLHVIAGAQIVVHVRNSLKLEGLTIHWHGVHMQDTPWMDGVPYVTQCPILPRQTFTYRFKADPPGTRWYHSHLGTQRLDGLYGMLVIYPSVPTRPEFVFTLTDWLEHDALMAELIPNAVNVDYVDDEYMKIGALINGRGRSSDLPYPLTEFKVAQGQTYRFRMASTGVEYSFEVSIDGHQMEIVAVDGGEIQPIRVDAYTIHIGETLDFEIVADQPVDTYWLRAVTLKGSLAPESSGRVKGVKAVITYEGATVTGDPTSSARVCTAAAPCKMFGCIYHGESVDHYTCIGVDEARSVANPLYLEALFGLNDPDNEVIEYFYNFAVEVGDSVNGRKYVNSRAPLYDADMDRYITPCDDEACDAEGCECTHIGELPHNKTIQMVIINQTPVHEDMAHHVIHLHGYSFAILKVGYAEQDETTGDWTRHNKDVQCYSDNLDLCTKARWTNQRPALNKVNPPIKNSVVLPSRGYAVVRFRSNNPGFWFFHCHMEPDFQGGMAMIINVGPDKHPPVPDDFPECGDFDWSAEDYSEFTAEARSIRLGTSSAESESEEVPVSETVPVVIPEASTDRGEVVLTINTAIGVSFGFVLLGACLPLIAIAMYVCCASSRESHSFK